MRAIAATALCQMCARTVAIMTRDREGKMRPVGQGYIPVPMMDRFGKTSYGVVCDDCRQGGKDHPEARGEGS